MSDSYEISRFGCIADGCIDEIFPIKNQKLTRSHGKKVSIALLDKKREGKLISNKMCDLIKTCYDINICDVI